MDNMNILRELIMDCVHVSANDITEQTSFDCLNMDSMDIAELIMAVEERFGILISDDAAIVSVTDLLNQINYQSLLPTGATAITA